MANKPMSQRPRKLLKDPAVARFARYHDIWLLQMMAKSTDVSFTVVLAMANLRQL
jgi:hypothetical protein